MRLLVLVGASWMVKLRVKHHEEDQQDSGWNVDDVYTWCKGVDKAELEWDVKKARGPCGLEKACQSCCPYYGSQNSGRRSSYFWWVTASSSSSRSHLVVGSLRQTQFSSSQFCHGPRLLSFRWLSCLGWHSPSISASVFLAFFSRVVPSPEWQHRRPLKLHLCMSSTLPALIPSLKTFLHLVSPE